MAQRQELLQQHDERWKKKEDTNRDMSSGKFVVHMQICIRCGKTFTFKKGRKNCPCCQGTLRTRVMVLKAP